MILEASFSRSSFVKAVTILGLPSFAFEHPGRVRPGKAVLASPARRWVERGC